MVSKEKPRAEAGKAGAKSKAVKAAGRKAAANEKAAPNEKATPNEKAVTGKAVGKKTPKKKKANKKSAATKHEVSTRTKKKSPAAGAQEANFAAGYAATDAAPAAGARDPFEVARETMKGSVPAIVEAMVAKAKRGSCTHAKTLLEMTGAKHMFGEAAESVDNGEPWAKLVLERMDEAEQESLTKDPPEVAAEG